MKSRFIAPAIVAAALCACAPTGEQSLATSPSSDPTALPREPMQAAPARGAQAWTDASWGFRIDVPHGWQIRHDFAHGYLANDSWKAYASPDSRGTAIVSFVLPGSNEITSAEIRVGASRDAYGIAHCTEPPDSMRGGSSHRESIGSAEFTVFEATDAAMSHYLEVHSYRVVHGGACYAIDLLVYGTNPEVYDPPAKPPFSSEQAFARMTPVLRTFRFTR